LDPGVSRITINYDGSHQFYLPTQAHPRVRPLAENENLPSAPALPSNATP
jgi:hypothetical protein